MHSRCSVAVVRTPHRLAAAWSLLGTVAAGWVLAALAFFTALAPQNAAAEPTIAESHAALLQEYHAELERLAKKCEGLDLTDLANTTRAAIVPRDPGRTYLFFPSKKTSELSPPSKANEPDDQSQRNVMYWRRRFTQVRNEHAGALYALAQRAVGSGQIAAAYRLAHETLSVFPEHASARHALQWIPPRAVQVKKMRLRDPRFGWSAGSYWRIDTQHYRILTNHSPEEGRFLGARLEELHNAWRQVFTEYWLPAATLRRRLEGKHVAMPSRGQKKLRIVLFRNKEEYVQTLSPLQSQIDVTVGIYFDENAAPRGWGNRAYFFAGEPRRLSTWRHEATHQLFHELAAVAGLVAEKNNMWLVEAVATYMESLEQRRVKTLSAWYTVGGVDARRLQFARVRCLNEHFYLPLEELSQLGRLGLQKHDDLRRLYSQSAGLAHFLMHYKGGRYRQGLLRTLRAVYTGRAAPATLAEATGQPYATLDQQYRAFLAINDDDLIAVPADSAAEMLALGGTHVTAKGIDHACKLKHLQWLDLAALPLNDQHANVLAQAKKLKHLNLQGAPLTDAGLRFLAKLKALKWLDLSQTRITDAGLPALAELTQLEELWLNGGRISDAGLSHFSSLRRLKVLGLEQTNVTEQGRAKLRKRLPSLEELY